MVYGFYMNLRTNAPGILAISAATGANARGVGAVPAIWFPNAPGAAAYIDIAADVDPAMLNGEITGMHAREIHQFSIAASVWMMELGRAHIAKELSADNILSYFAMVRVRVSNPRPIIAFLDWFCGAFSVTLNDNAILDLTRSTTWGQYRTTVSSVVQLYDNFRRDFGMITDDIMGQPNIVLIEALRTNPEDIQRHRVIPQIVLAKLYIGLQTSGSVPNNWYSGERALNTINNATRNAWRAGFTELLERRFDLANVQNAANIDGVIDATGLRHA
jgi:hypothetical protein